MSKAFTIPKQFSLLGHTIKVCQEDHPGLFEKRYGFAHFQTNTIALEKFSRQTDKTISEQVFFHELVHFILYYMGEEELNNNEKFVDMFGQLLYQAMTTKQ